MTDEKVREAVASIESAGRALEAIQKAVQEYHLALDLRHHGDVAANRLARAVQDALAMPWVPGAEAAKRQEKANG